ncbi:MAG: hypothetical protein FWF90_03920 [Promicromonosporaceae bacterium]|nr:hypothetical protein [Promicromonosporaceae bacterium]
MAGTSRGDGAGHDDGAPGDGARDAADGNGGIEDAEVEARWADIVAQLGDIDKEADDDAGEVAPETPAPPVTGHVVARPTGPRDWPATPDVEALEDAQSHFTPPDPGPVITGRDPLVTLAWAVAAGVPLLAVVALIVRSFVSGLFVPGWVGPLAVLAFLAAVAVLVWRMPSHRDPDDHDDGAVV